MDDMKPHVFIAMPCYGGQLSEATFSSFMKLAGGKYFDWSVSTLANEALISRGSNTLAARMLADKDATHLMFIDSDMRFEPEDIVKLIKADKDIVAGLCPVKKYPITFALNGLEDAVQEGPLEEVEHIGTAFMLIKREVLEVMSEWHPELKYSSDCGEPEICDPYLYDLFGVGVVSGQYMSEDWMFCYRWRRLSGKVWAHKDVLINHVGYHEFQARQHADIQE